MISALTDNPNERESQERFGMALPLTLFGATDCDDTERTRDRLDALGVAYREINIDEDEAAERFVIFINSGFRSTPTLVFGEGKLKIILTEPEDEDLDKWLTFSGS